MVNVKSAHLNVAERSNPVNDGGNQQTNRKESKEEAYGGQKEPALRAIGNLLVDDVSELREMQEQKDGSR